MTSVLYKRLDLQSFFEPIFYVTSTSYRVFWGYLLLSAMIAAYILYQNKHSLISAVRFLCSKRLWKHPSFLLDFKLIFMNHALWVLFIIPWLGSQVSFALYVSRTLRHYLGTGDFIHFDTLSINIIYTFLLFIIDDLSRFIVHKCYHTIPWLWRFHAVHHSAKLMTPFTLYRVHIIEMFINALRSILVFGGIGGIAIYMVDGRINTLTILGSSIFSLLFNIAGANLRHSHVWFSFGILEKWIISPAQHQIHHSVDPQHYNKNYGVMLAVWDKLSDTWLASKDQSVEEFGIDTPVEQSLKSHILGIKM